MKCNYPSRFVLSTFVSVLFSASAAEPQLEVQLLPDRRVAVSWTAPTNDWTLETTDGLNIPVSWQAVNLTPTVQGNQLSVTLVPSAIDQFFRLRSSSGAPAVTSEKLIDEAVASGALNEEDAALYRVYAQFKDPRLPAAYRGNDTGAIESHAFEKALDLWETFSEQTRAALTPFFIPPAYSGSWYNPTPAAAFKPQAVERPEPDANWAAVPVSGGNVKVWYDSRDPNGHATALFCANALNNEIWPKLTGLGILAPLDDMGTARYDGGDSRLDVYIVDMAAQGVVATHLGITSAVSAARKQHPVFLMINKTLPPDKMAATLAHEFMHACQWAYDVEAFSLSSYQWLKESTAQWALDYVYPTNQLEHTPYAKAYLDAPRMSLDVFEGNENHGYGSYLFFQYLSRTVGPAVIKDIWAATATYSDQLEAVDKSIPGGFKEQFPKFVKTLWNQDPIVSKPASFKAWDDLTDVPATREGPADLPAGATEDSIELSDDQPNLSSTYYHFTFATVETRSLMFHNTFYTNRKNSEPVNVQAMWKNTAGVWTEEDWSTLEWIGFCRDQKDQRLTDLVVIVSSAKWQDTDEPIKAAKVPEFKRNNIGCWGYEGTAKRETSAETFGGSGKTTASATARYGFRPSPQLTDPAQGRLRVFLIAPVFDAGGVQFNEQYSVDGCSYSASGSFPMTSVVVGGDTASSIVMNNFAEAMLPEMRAEVTSLIGPDERAYTANGATGRQLIGSVRGVDCGDTTYEVTIGAWLLTNDASFEDGGVMPKVQADGHLRGRFVDPSDESVFMWDLAPIQEP
ncbi:MAG TPA: DUF6055 domain-containing protein [Verrucomicrobiae bacterium]|nr:DUF6055 domain-containing protein [Verrucomicrobiae bacterium]